MKRNQLKDRLNAVKKGSRELELELHDRPVNYTRICKSKKQYTRKIKHK